MLKPWSIILAVTDNFLAETKTLIVSMKVPDSFWINEKSQKFACFEGAQYLDNVSFQHQLKWILNLYMTMLLYRLHVSLLLVQRFCKSMFHSYLQQSRIDSVVARMRRTHLNSFYDHAKPPGCKHQKDLFSIRSNATLESHLHVYFQKLCPFLPNFETFYTNTNSQAFCNIWYILI